MSSLNSTTWKETYFIQRSMTALLFFVIFSSPSSLAAEPIKTFSTDETYAFFNAYPNIIVNKTQRSTFRLEIQGNKATRKCPSCRVMTGNGEVRYDHTNNQICLYWDNVSYPDSGCFQLEQHDESGFVLRSERGTTPYRWQLTSYTTPPVPDDEFERSILLDLSSYQLTAEKINAAIMRSLQERGWRIFKSEPGKYVAYLIKSNTEYRVMIKIKDDWVSIGHTKGFAPSRDGWLRNIEKSILKNIY